ncbi:hypothetical protein ABEB36_007843 [Hypothenemus hampei]|uniref:Regulatory protein zeste n=1 Tax=Hypothenemus hampei TaxID=57062 RepID=A0ABD1EVF0_HYPHA
MRKKKTNNTPVMKKIKRSRAPNFTSSEIRTLIQAATKHCAILEDRTIDLINWEKKNETWKQIADEFNATNTNNVFRTDKVLRNKYDNLKKDLKKKVSYNKAQTYSIVRDTSGYIKLNEDEKELLKLIALSVNGLPTEPESNEILPITTITRELRHSSSSTKECIEQSIEKLEDPSNFVIVSNNSAIFEDEFVENGLVEENMFDASIAIAKEMEIVSAPNISSQFDMNTQMTQNWKSDVKRNQSWCPSPLQSKKHSALKVKKTITADRIALNAKIEQLAESKIELVTLQKTYAISEEERRVKQYEAEVEKLRQAAEQQKLEHLKIIEILEIEMQIKRKQLLL